MKNLTVDTNVLEHANNGQESRCEDSIALITFILENKIPICLDYQKSKGFNFEASIIWQEYQSRINPGMLANEFLVKVLTSRLFEPVKRKVTGKPKKEIEQKVKKPNDRTFLKVTYNSKSKILISHDFEDFQEDKRKHFKKSIGINIIEASDL